jgi:dienelactone hydrolase
MPQLATLLDLPRPTRLRRTAVLLGACVLCGLRAGGADTTSRQRAELDVMERCLLPSRPAQNGRMNAHDRTWEDWQRRTGELPPDFSQLPSRPFLPDPLVSDDGPRGRPITTSQQWSARRQWLRSQFEQWVYGRMPPPPGNVRAVVQNQRQEGDITIRDVLLEFGPDHRARLHLQLMIPPGQGPFPVFLTNHSPDNLLTARVGHDHSFWARTAVSRGYIGCYYQATDPIYGKPDDSDAYIELYPDYDFACLARWAWAASRAVDYLVTLPNVDAEKIGLAGHSRNGKQALLAAAFDERIGAVVASSGLQGEVLPHRYTSDPFAIESIELITGAQPHWYSPRLRFFAGREDQLPIDQNELLALVAPRGLMLYSGTAEPSSSSFGSEQSYRSALTAYRFLGAERNLWLHLRPGNHSVWEEDVENFVDFFDSVFGRHRFPKVENQIHDYDFAAWKKMSGEAVDPAKYPVQRPGEFLRGDEGHPVSTRAAWQARTTPLRERIRWALGDAPAEMSVDHIDHLTEQDPPELNPAEMVLGRPQRNRAWQEKLAAASMGISSLPYAAGQTATVFYPLGPAGRMRAGRLPVVIWLHPFAYDSGWSAKEPWQPSQPDYVLDLRPSIDSLVGRGFVVITFDQIGFGGRSGEAQRFYERHPHWSLMGKMVGDTRAAVAAAAALKNVDASRIYLLGYSLGAKVALLTAALDPAVCGVASVCGVDPLRLDTPDRGTEGLQLYSVLHGLMPRLGFFVGQESRLPFDYDEVLSLIAPRPALVVAPQYDRYARIGDVRQVLDPAAKVYRLLGNPNALEVWMPPDFNRFPRALQERTFDYLAKIRGGRTVAPPPLPPAPSQSPP